MSAGSDSEYEEQEVVVLAHLHGLVDDDLLTNGCSWQLVGIDRPRPVLQLGKYTFLGDYQDQVGTALFLKENIAADGTKLWSKVCFSDKKLDMQRVFLKKKGADAEAEAAAQQQEAVAMETDAAEPAAASSEGDVRLREQAGGVDGARAPQTSPQASVSVSVVPGNNGARSAATSTHDGGSSPEPV